MAMKFRKGLHLASVLTTTFTILTAGRHLRGQPPAPRVVQVFPLQFQAEIPRDVTALIEFNEPLHSLCDPPDYSARAYDRNGVELESFDPNQLRWELASNGLLLTTRSPQGLPPNAAIVLAVNCLAAADGRLLEYYQTTFYTSERFGTNAATELVLTNSVILPEGDLEFAFNTEPGRSYRIQWNSEAWQTNGWQEWMTTNAAAETVTVKAAAKLLPARFFRVIGN